jgi:hypothetical protein
MTSQRQIAFARALPILIGTLLCGTIIAVLALRTIRTVNQSEALVQRFAEVAPVCDGQPFPGAAPYQPGDETPITATFRQSNDRWLLDPGALPQTWQPQNAGDVQLVLCLGATQELTTERCQPDEDGAQPTRPYGQAMFARLLTAQDATLLAEEILQTGPDPGCWEEEPEAETIGPERLREWVVGELEIGD